MTQLSSIPPCTFSSMDVEEQGRLRGDTKVEGPLLEGQDGNDPSGGPRPGLLIGRNLNDENGHRTDGVSREVPGIEKVGVTLV